MELEQASQEVKKRNTEAGWDKHWLFPLANGLWAVATSWRKPEPKKPELTAKVSIWEQRNGELTRTWVYGG